MARRGRHRCAGSGLEGGGHQVIRVSCLLPPLPPSQTDRVSVAPGGRSVSCLPLWCLSSAIAMPWPCSSSLPRRRRPHRLLRAGSRQQGPGRLPPVLGPLLGLPRTFKATVSPTSTPLLAAPLLAAPAPQDGVQTPSAGPSRPSGRGPPPALRACPVSSHLHSSPARRRGPGSWGVTSSLTPCPVCGAPAHLQHSSQERLSEPSCRFLRWN